MGTATAGLADELARWATELDPSQEDLALARRSLLDTVAVMFAARTHPLREVFGQLSEPGGWSALAHVLDYDDLHLPSTTHVSAVCVPVRSPPAAATARTSPAPARWPGSAPPSGGGTTAPVGMRRALRARRQRR